MTTSFLESSAAIFRSYKVLAEGALKQISDEALCLSVTAESNSIAVIVKHLHGNMLSRWTDFLSTDGEKEWRERDAEFEVGRVERAELMRWWEDGWACLFDSLSQLNDSDLNKIVKIRAEKHSVMEAIQRQLTHSAYHVGQIVYLAKMLSPAGWTSLSVARGKSKEYEAEMRKKYSESGE